MPARQVCFPSRRPGSVGVGDTRRSIPSPCSEVSLMRILDFSVFCALATLSLVAGAVVALRLTQPEQGAVALKTPADAPIAPSHIYPSQHPEHFAGSSSGSQADANTLELHKANVDFVGYWGGYIHSSIQRLDTDLTGSSPERVSVVFGRHGDTVFMRSELYSSSGQTIVRRPKARMVGARQTLVDYEYTDKELYYSASHSFRLDGTSSITYRSAVNIYELNSHRLLGVVTERATLRRLETPKEQLEFSRPGRNQIPRTEISASNTHGMARTAAGSN